MHLKIDIGDYLMFIPVKSTNVVETINYLKIIIVFLFINCLGLPSRAGFIGDRA